MFGLNKKLKFTNNVTKGDKIEQNTAEMTAGEWIPTLMIDANGHLSRMEGYMASIATSLAILSNRMHPATTPAKEPEEGASDGN